MGREKNYFLNSTIYFRFLAVYQLIMPPKQWHCASPAPHARHTSPSNPPPSWKPVFGWLLHNKSSIGGRLRPQCIFVFFIFCCSICRPKQWDNAPHTFRPGRVSSLTPPSPLATTLGWLLCLHIKLRPSKANGTHISLFFFSINLTPPNDGQPSSPHPAQPCLFSNAPSKANIVCHLIVV
jgi:hypothetical protein